MENNSQPDIPTKRGRKTKQPTTENEQKAAPVKESKKKETERLLKEIHEAVKLTEQLLREKHENERAVLLG